MRDELRQETLSLADIDLLGRMYDASVGRFHGEVRLAGKDLTRARKLAKGPLDVVEPGRLTDKHYQLTAAGRSFVEGFRKR